MLVSVGVGGVALMSKWRTTHHCTVCEERLTTRQQMYSDGCCPHCGNTVEGTIVATFKRSSQVKTAWTILKLKVVKRALGVLLRVHIWWELRHQRKVHPSHTEGPIGRERIRKAVAQVKKRTKR